MCALIRVRGLGWACVWLRGFFVGFLAFRRFGVGFRIVVT